MFNFNIQMHSTISPWKQKPRLIFRLQGSFTKEPELSHSLQGMERQRRSERLIIGAKTMQAWRLKLDFEHEDVIIDPRVTRIRLLLLQVMLAKGITPIWVCEAVAKPKIGAWILLSQFNVCVIPAGFFSSLSHASYPEDLKRIEARCQRLASLNHLSERQEN